MEEALLASALTLAEDLALPLTVLSAPVEDGANLESRARDARWQGIRANLAPGEVVVTGHSLDDLAETVLINLLRGAGSRGLAAMSVRRNGVVRPLTGTSRADLRGVAETLGLPFVDDPANADPRHLRNRIRADLIPYSNATTSRGCERRWGGPPPISPVTIPRSKLPPARSRAGGWRRPAASHPGAGDAPQAGGGARRAPDAAQDPSPVRGKASDIDTVLSVAAGGNRTATLGSGVTVSRRRPLRGPVDRSTTGA